jgi:formylmethanofuran dehydrogenase subunit C
MNGGKITERKRRIVLRYRMEGASSSSTETQESPGIIPRGEWRGMQGGLIRVGGSVANDTATFINGGTIIIGGDADIHVSTHGEGGTVVIKGNAKGRVGGQMVKGSIYVYGTIENPLPGFQMVGEVEQEVDGETATFAHYIGDLGERHPVSKGKTVYANLYTRL